MQCTKTILIQDNREPVLSKLINCEGVVRYRSFSKYLVLAAMFLRSESRLAFIGLYRCLRLRSLHAIHRVHPFLRRMFRLAHNHHLLDTDDSSGHHLLPGLTSAIDEAMDPLQ